MNTRSMNADQMLAFARNRLRMRRDRRRRGHLYMFDQQPGITPGVEEDGGGGGGGPDTNLDDGDVDTGSGTVPDGGTGWDAFDSGSDGASSDGGSDSSGGADDGGDDDGGDDGGTVSPFDGQATNSQQQHTLAILPTAQGGGGGGSGQGSPSLARMLSGLMGYGG